MAEYYIITGPSDGFFIGELIVTVDEYYYAILNRIDRAKYPNYCDFYDGCTFAIKELINERTYIGGLLVLHIGITKLSEEEYDYYRILFRLGTSTENILKVIAPIAQRKEQGVSNP